MSIGFVHLHTHTEYSVLDGASKIAELLERCERYGMRACAITDHGALFGVHEFYKAAQKRGIKPIIGCELYVARDSRFEKKGRGGNYNHFLLLCENETGYHNLCQLSTLGYLEGYHYRPRVDIELLRKYSEGLIATSACLAGEIPQLLKVDDWDGANEAVRKYISIYGRDRFLIEVQDHGLADQKKTNPMLLELAEHHGLMAIASNDCHYVDKEDAEAHDALLCVQTNSTLDDPNRFRFETNQFYFCSGEEMRAKFPGRADLLENTVKVAERCQFEMPPQKNLTPKYEPPEGLSPAEYLRRLVRLGLEDRYGGQPPKERLERAEYELGVIEGMGFVDYFLVVWDFINFARSRGIPVGPGRGSGAGSLVAYALKITNIDPIRYNLLFERFLNPERISMPDFDIDFCYERREEVIDYVRRKYGEGNVCQIITFGRMLAKNVVRNVGRVMGMSYGDVDRIAKLIPDELKITLASAAEKEPELKRLIAEDPQVARLWRLAERLEGTVGNCGTHAAGVVICDHPLTEHCALFKAPGSDIVATQLEMKGVEETGLLKMDFLGLRTLTVIHHAVRFIKQNRGIVIDIDNIEPDDPKAYALLRSGRTMGVFQLESAGMRDLAKRIGLESLEEICALIALYRPGPMQLKDEYIENKLHPERIKYDLPQLEPILKETYGIALYQEQVMQMAQAAAGFTLGQADILRRAMGKKDPKLMAKQRERFIEGCAKNKIGKKMAGELFGKIEQFAGYGFNKSHSMAYAYVAYQTAFLKANYPVEFMTALLTSESNNHDKVAVYVDECRRMDIEVAPPDVNASGVGFTVEGDRIRFGLGAVKNVGAAPAEAIVAEREVNGPYRDVFDFCGRLDSRNINRRVIESLNRAGAFASTGWNRRQVESVIDSAIEEGQISQRERASGQTSLFDLMGDSGSAEAIHQKPELAEWPEGELLASEKEMLGLYVSSHPLARHAETLDRYSNVSLASLEGLREGQEVIFGGMITAARPYLTKKGRKMAFVAVESLQGSCEFTAFADLYEPNAGLIVPDKIVMVRAKVNYRNGQLSFLADEVIPIEEAPQRLTRAIHIRLNTIGLEDFLIERLAEIIGEQPGPCDVYLHCETSAREEVVVHAAEAARAAATPRLKERVEELLGEDTLWFSGGNGFSRHP